MQNMHKNMQNMSDQKTFQVCNKICKICNKDAKYVSQNLICGICTPHRDFADVRFSAYILLAASRDTAGRAWETPSCYFTLRA